MQETVGLALDRGVENVRAAVVAGIAQGVETADEHQAMRLEVAESEGFLDPMQCLRIGLAGAFARGVIDNQQRPDLRRAIVRKFFARASSVIDLLKTLQFFKFF